LKWILLQSIKKEIQRIDKVTYGSVTRKGFDYYEERYSKSRA